jgi:diacylglycerol O-acyltransferase
MHYERLSALDTSFLVQEGRFTYMHIAATAIFAPESLVVAGTGAVDIERIRHYVASRLHLVPRYRQRLGYVPVTNDPVWVDDDRFDLAYHVRHVSLPRPGSEEQLRQLCGRIIERHLDRARPLWECWFVEGLSGGRFAMVTKVHHCMVDGIGGVDLLAALFTMAPKHGIEAREPWSPRPAPQGRELLREEAVRRGKAVLGAVANLGADDAGAKGAAASLRNTAEGIWSFARRGFRRPLRLPFNATVGPNRRIEWLRQSLDDVRAVKGVLGGTLNDVVLATVAGTFHRFLGSIGVSAAKCVLRAAVPVSVRAAGEQGAGGNRVSVWLVDLPVGERDPWRRLSAVCQATEELRRSHQAEAAQALAEIAEWTGANLLGHALRLANNAQPFNLIVTNVPGPPMPLYLLDARMEAIYPHLPLFEGQGLGIALLSYAGEITWGLTGDWDLMPKLDELRTALVRSFDELSHLARKLEIERRLRSGELRVVGDTVGSQVPGRDPRQDLYVS